MSAAEEAAKLRAQADALEVVGTLTEAMDQAKAAFLAERTPENKSAFREASKALSDAREDHRSKRSAVLAEPGSVTITPGGVSVSGGAL